MPTIQSTCQHNYAYDTDTPVYSSCNSTIYRAKDLTFNRTVCLKVLKCETTEQQRLFQREITVQTNIGEKCANIPTLIDTWYNQSQQELYIVMQWIPGKTLQTIMNEMPANIFLINIGTLCDILQVFFYEKMSHKDIKPENIMITPQGSLYLIDFNLTLTSPELGIGTRDYRAPELFMAGTSTDFKKADIFSIGVMLYEFFTGVRPVRNSHYCLDIFNTDQAHWTSFKQPKEINSTIPDELNQLIVKCMALSPNDRYRDPATIKRELKNCRSKLTNWRKN